MTSAGIGLLAAGLVALVVGAELLIRGAARLAASFGVPPLLIGLTVVAFGTSAPELAVSLKAAASGSADIAVGNVVGSNIFNVLFILGISALIQPLSVSRQLVRLDVPIMIALSLLLLWMALDGRIGLREGSALTAGAVLYTLLAVRVGMRDAAGDGAAKVKDVAPRSRGPAATLASAALVIAGLFVLVAGARWFVDGAVALARAFAISETVIGLTVVAAGTSLPEVAASIVASLRGQRDIAVGNVVGSCIYNVVAILGLSTLVSAGGLAVAPSVIHFDLPVMIAAAVACMPVFFTGYEIRRWEGALFLFYYVAYTLFLVLDATAHDALGTYTLAMGTVVLPLTGITLVVLTGWGLARGGGNRT